MFKIYSTCVFNFPDSILFDHIVSIFSLSHSGKMWLHGLSILWMSKKYANLVHCNHMTQYILNVTTMSGSNTCWSLSLGNLKSTEHLLMGHIVVTWSSTSWIFSQLTELENCKYIVQCILKELSMFWFRKVLVFWTWNHHVLSTYWLSTEGFAPSECSSDVPPPFLMSSLASRFSLLLLRVSCTLLFSLWLFLFRYK